MEKVTITFANEISIEADVNGSCYIVDDPLSDELTKDLSKVTIENNDGIKTVLNNVLLVKPYSIDGRFWFAFHEISESEKLKADVEYLLLLSE